MPTSYTTRTIPNTSYNITRLGGEYLLDWNGEQILDWNSEPIITIVPGGHLPITDWTGRPVYHLLTFAELEEQTFADLGTDTFADLYTGLFPTPYTVRTPI